MCQEPGDVTTSGRAQGGRVDRQTGTEAPAQLLGPGNAGCVMLSLITRRRETRQTQYLEALGLVVRCGFVVRSLVLLKIGKVYCMLAPTSVHS